MAWTSPRARVGQGPGGRCRARRTSRTGNAGEHPRDISAAHRAGGHALYSADSENELTKIAAYAPGAHCGCVPRCRTVRCSPLTQKFGASPTPCPILPPRPCPRPRRPRPVISTSDRSRRPPRLCDRTGHGPRLDLQIPAVDHPLAVNIGGGLPGYGYPPPRVSQPVSTNTGRPFTTGMPSPVRSTQRHLGRRTRTFPIADAGIMATRAGRQSSAWLPDYLILEVGRFSGLSEADLLPPHVTAHPIDVGRPQPLHRRRPDLRYR